MNDFNTERGTDRKMNTAMAIGEIAGLPKNDS